MAAERGQLTNSLATCRLPPRTAAACLAQLCSCCRMLPLALAGRCCSCKIRQIHHHQRRQQAGNHHRQGGHTGCARAWSTGEEMPRAARAHTCASCRSVVAGRFASIACVALQACPRLWTSTRLRRGRTSCWTSSVSCSSSWLLSEPARNTGQLETALWVQLVGDCSQGTWRHAESALDTSDGGPGSRLGVRDGRGFRICEEDAAGTESESDLTYLHSCKDFACCGPCPKARSTHSILGQPVSVPVIAPAAHLPQQRHWHSICP